MYTNMLVLRVQNNEQMECVTIYKNKHMVMFVLALYNQFKKCINTKPIVSSVYVIQKDTEYKRV